MKLNKLNLLSLSVLSILSTQIFAETQPQVLPTLTVQAVDKIKENDGTVAKKASSVLKSDAPLFETAQSVSVVTEEQMQQKQVTTMTEALQGISGVVAGNMGRRGFDDVIIRGQTSSDNYFIDGLRPAVNTSHSIEPFGMESIQVLKGPASVGFGLVAPGGVVNATLKKPQETSFNRIGLTYGSNDNKQATFDFNYAPNEGTDKGAFRFVALVSDKDDPTDYVYFKNYYFAPSYTFDLGDKTDLTINASYRHRDYVRSQQGIPVQTYLNGVKTKKGLNINEPDDKYTYDIYRAGYEFKHQFANDWLFKQNFSVFHQEYAGRLVAIRGYVNGSNYSKITRRSAYQNPITTSLSIDNQLSNTFNFANTEHHVMFGIDGMWDKAKNTNTQSNNTGNNLDLLNPVYGVAKLTTTSQKQTKLETNYLGVYARDQIKWNDKLILNLAGRYDWATSHNKINGNKTHDNAFSGNASVMYKFNNMIAPYVSYATSFIPQTGSDYSGNAFDPEKGKQIEAGFKFQSPDERMQGALTWYDLKKTNVLVSDPDHDNYSILAGEQQSKGVELEVSANITPQWNASASYGYTYKAEISKSTVASQLGQLLNPVPKHTFNVATHYYFSPSHLGWHIGGDVNYVGTKATNLGFKIPSYTVLNLQAGYKAEHWGANLGVKNVFDKEYYAGLLGSLVTQAVVTYGDPRQVNFTVNFDF